MTAALDGLNTLLADVDNLIDYHPGAGRPAKDAGPLLRSCVVLTYAAWEVYAEDSIVWAADECAKAARFLDLPPAMRKFTADSVVSNPAGLADDGWRELLKSSARTKVRGDDSDTANWGLNTASPQQVISLQQSILGERLLNRCSWNGKGNAAVKSDLATLVRVRGAIVHTGYTPRDLDLAGVRNWRNFIQRLSQTLDTQIVKWVEEVLP